MKLFLFQILLFLLTLLVEQCKPLLSTCNYVYNSLEKTAWATKVCIPWDTQSTSNYHVQYICVNDSMNVQYYSDSQCSNLVTTINLANYIQLLNQSNDSSALIYSYSCKGRDGCYAEYLENCESSSNSIYYSPIQSCIVDSSTSSSWMIDCDDTALFYTSYSDNNCQQLVTLQLVTGCTQIDNTTNTTWEYWGCKLPPTPVPTSVPSKIPSLMPTNSPTNLPTFYPTWYIPFYDLNLSGIVNNIQNDNSSKSVMISSLNIYSLLAMLFVYSLMIVT